MLVEIGLFPVVCGWWLDICSLVSTYLISAVATYVYVYSFADTSGVHMFLVFTVFVWCNIKGQTPQSQYSSW